MKLAVVYLIIINIITLCLYGLDKHAAVKQKWRIPNRVLIGLAAFGGTIGALVGMYLFRHKTKTKLYTVTVPLLLIIQIIAVMLLLSSCGNDLAASAVNINSEPSITTEEQAAVKEYDYEYDDDSDEEYDESEMDIDEEDAEEESEAEANADAETYKVVLNSNPSRMRYHMPECRGVKDISKAHYQEYELTKEEIKEKQDKAGWIPCGWCHPDRKLGIDQ